MSVISLSHSTCLAHKVLDPGTFDFNKYSICYKTRPLTMGYSLGILKIEGS